MTISSRLGTRLKALCPGKRHRLSWIMRLPTSGSRRQANEPDMLGAEERTASPCNTSVKRLVLQIALSA